jgi:hypothetical protein
VRQAGLAGFGAFWWNTRATASADAVRSKAPDGSTLALLKRLLEKARGMVRQNV